MYYMYMPVFLVRQIFNIVGNLLCTLSCKNNNLPSICSSIRLYY